MQRQTTLYETLEVSPAADAHLVARAFAFRPLV
jgi:hypothetical protein